MKALLKVVAAVFFAAVCVGGTYTYAQSKINVETRLFQESVHSGDRFNTIIEKYYDESINPCWDEWQTTQKQINHKLFEKGRAPQPGDTVYIVTRVRIEK